MAFFNMTVEDSSPLITYAPAGSWTDTPNNDPLVASYSGASYHTTSSQGATATIIFTGTGLSIFGGRKPNYGTYSVSVDGQNIATGSSQATAAATRQILASTSGLNYGSHTAVLTNTGGIPIDIDWVDFETRMGQPGSTVIRNTFDDTDSKIVYSPSPAAWQSNSNPGFFDNTLHFSQIPGASASMNFSGEAVALYGTVSPDHANIVVTIDGQAVNLPGGAGGFASVVHPAVLLYYRGDLDSTADHTITLSGSSQPGTGPFIDLDMITVFAAVAAVNPNSLANPTLAVNPTPSVTPTPSINPTPLVGPFITKSTGTAAAAENTSAPSSSSSASTGSAPNFRMSTGVIIGAVLGGLTILLLLIGITAFLCFRHRRNRSARMEKSMISISPMLPMQTNLRTPVLPMQRDPNALEAGGMRSLENPVFPFPVQPRKAASLRHSIAPSYYSNPSYASHSRDASVLSSGSTAPLVQTVPTISVPQPRSNIPRKPVPANSGSIYTTRPARPSNRPPTFDFTQIESLRY